MTKEEIIQTVGVTFPSGEMLPVVVFRDWLENILIPQLWREPNSAGANGPLPIIYGATDPNVNAPTEPYEIGYFYTQTSDGTESGIINSFYQNNGKEWVKIASIENQDYVTYKSQSKTIAEQKVAQKNIGMAFNEEDINPLEYYTNELN